MPAGAITGYFDVAQVTLYAFWIFFAGLIFYLRREDKREGYPLDSDRSNLVRVEGFPGVPKPKYFHLPNGEVRSAPRPAEGPVTIRGLRTATSPGSPLVPQHQGMLDAIGPAAYAGRPTVPDSDDGHGGPKIVPMRVVPDFFVSEEDPDPRGWPVLGADKRVAGTVADLWVDRTEVLIRYVEVQTPQPLGGIGAPRRVLVPMPLVRLDTKGQRLVVKSVLAAQFADAPGLAHADQITLREEDQVSAYFGGGNLYAMPQRQGPVL